MVYIGNGALAANGRGPEPSLIEPHLAVHWKTPDRTGGSVNKNPSYRMADPRGRAAYLKWLARGRSDKSVPIGYVLLFFYGLERRLFADLGADLHLPEVTTILAEIERLLGIHHKERSFARSASQLLDFIEGVRSVDTDVQPSPWVDGRVKIGVPAAVRISIGKCVSKGSPIPAGWALHYLRHHPERRLRTPSERVAAEFDELFGIRYRARFGDGLQIPKPARRIRLSYRATSPGFDGGVFITLKGIPDVALEPALITELNELAEQCDDDLDAYSRYVGRYPDQVGTPVAHGLLPDVLIAESGGPIHDDLRVWTSEVLAGDRRSVILLDELVERWWPGRAQKLTKTEAVALASTLAKIGVGIEPDVRFGSPIPGRRTQAVLFPLPEGAPTKATPLYDAALSLVYLGALVATADGRINSSERRFLAERLEGIPGLDATDRLRLRAHLALLGVRKPRMYGVKKRVKAMKPGDLPRVGGVLIELAAVDGTVKPAEITMLEKLFEHMGLDEAHLYSRAHTLGLGDTGPVTVREGAPDTRWELPEAGSVAGRRRSVSLDPQKVQARLAETNRVASLLTDIFVDDDLPPEAKSSSHGPEPGSIIEGLDGPHSQLLEVLTTRAEWDRGSAEELARSLGLPFLDGALDMINETALDSCGEAVVEGDDPVVLNAYALAELACHP